MLNPVNEDESSKSGNEAQEITKGKMQIHHSAPCTHFHKLI